MFKVVCILACVVLALADPWDGNAIAEAVSYIYSPFFVYFDSY